MTDTITLTRPDDWHLHLRDGAAMEAVLADKRFTSRHLSRVGPYYALPGREETATIRQERGRLARQLWPVAMQYGRLLASLPFTRMVAVTGSLAVDNVAPDGDIDYLLVAANGRVWLNRAFAIALVRLATRRGYSLCPNYILAERALHFPDHNLYTAHEVVQMMPLSGLNIYAHIRQINSWTTTFLPNAIGLPREMGRNAQTPATVNGTARGNVLDVSRSAHRNPARDTRPQTQ